MYIIFLARYHEINTSLIGYGDHGFAIQSFPEQG